MKQVYYPSTGEFKGNYDRCKRENGGYGGLLSITFNSEKDAICFYDLIETAKGPSLGTNFTLTSPYTLLAHYRELDWVSVVQIVRSHHTATLTHAFVLGCSIWR